MAVLPFQPTPFFANKNRAFWNLQVAGWGGAFMLRAMSTLANEKNFDFIVLNLIATVTGFSISLILAVVYRQLINSRPVVTWGMTAVVLTVAVVLYASLDTWVMDLYYPNRESSFTSRFLGITYIDLTLLGAWSALYYAINFFLQVEEQADQLERLEAQATGAQLAMLRYQLNPHFLFNTLNSISTLVLLKQTTPANAMLTRLSSFLRHTLVSQPGGKVTLEQEVETLKLYLGIERMRFEERLRTDFSIAEDTKQALLPAMLLQPLVENAIKYAVSPQEEGAKITILAETVGTRLRLKVSDSGPGMAAKSAPNALARAMPVIGRRREVAARQNASGSGSTGVGLANTRDRLSQAYGEDHMFDISSPPEGGFVVTVELPFELESDESHRDGFDDGHHHDEDNGVDVGGVDSVEGGSDGQDYRVSNAEDHVEDQGGTRGEEILEAEWAEEEALAELPRPETMRRGFSVETSSNDEASPQAAPEKSAYTPHLSQGDSMGGMQVASHQSSHFAGEDEQQEDEDNSGWNAQNDPLHAQRNRGDRLRSDQNHLDNGHPDQNHPDYGHPHHSHPDRDQSQSDQSQFDHSNSNHSHSNHSHSNHSPFDHSLSERGQSERGHPEQAPYDRGRTQSQRKR